jgi:hypothetical protein
MRHSIVGFATAIAVVASIASAGESGVATAKVLLSIEPLLIDSAGIHPMTGAEQGLLETEDTGSYNQVIRLGPDATSAVAFKLAYKMSEKRMIQLRLERTLERRGSRETLPPIEHEIEPTGVWTTTLLQETGQGGRIDLRVLPVIRADVADEAFSGKKLMTMRLKEGPLVQFGGGSADRVVFRDVNVIGSGLAMGITSVGVVKLALEPFPGAKECGWVRGHVLSFSFGPFSYKAWSILSILPEDPSRPGKGWKLFGVLEPNASTEGFWSNFEPHP